MYAIIEAGVRPKGFVIEPDSHPAHFLNNAQTVLATNFQLAANMGAVALYVAVPSARLKEYVFRYGTSWDTGRGTQLPITYIASDTRTPSHARTTRRALRAAYDDGARSFLVLVGNVTRLQISNPDFSELVNTAFHDASAAILIDTSMHLFTKAMHECEPLHGDKLLTVDVLEHMATTKKLSVIKDFV